MQSAFEPLVQNLCDSLAKPAAFASLERDPYWPKWDSPWWHLSTLFEMGLIGRAPAEIIQKLVAEMQKRQPTEPYTEDSPICHCQLGLLYQVLSGAGVAVDTELPWIRPWLLKHQHPDGGLNCDDASSKGSL